MNRRNVKKIIVLLFGLILQIIVTSCNIADDSTAVQTKPTNFTDTSEVVYQRIVPFEVKDEIIDALSLDDYSISVLDDLYLSAFSSLGSLSAKKIIDQIYESNNIYSEKYYILWQQYYDNIGSPTDLFKEYAIENTASVLITCSICDEAEGLISAEKSAYEVVSLVDELCDFYYEDYVPILSNEVIAVDTIVDLYENNELLAGKEYENKLLNITGVITEISKDLYDKTYVAINNGNKYADEIRCYFSDDFNEEILKLKKGDNVTLTAQIIKKDTLYIEAKLWNINLDNN